MTLLQNKYLRFILALVGIILFITVVAPFIKKIPVARQVYQVIDEKSIDATPLFYTEMDD